MATEHHLTCHFQSTGNDFPEHCAEMEKYESRLRGKEFQDGPTMSAMSTRGLGNRMLGEQVQFLDTP